jgi:tRNA A37 threonylcarbamoyladenosine modification protein TsaB
MAMAADIPLIGVSTLASSVRGWQCNGLPVVGVVRAGRARYGWASDTDVDAAKTGTAAGLVDFVRESGASIVVGELAEADAIRLRELTNVYVPAAPGRLRRAGNLAQIGWERWRAGDFDPLAVPEPTYLHRT